MILEIIKYPNDILTRESKEVSADFIISKEAKKMTRDMKKTMRAANGIGLAAAQVGKNIRMCVISKTCTGKNKDIVLFNPRWEKTSKKRKSMLEGCLSLPKMLGDVSRYKHIQVKALDKNGREINFHANGLLARVIQHEVDHMDGILFISKAKNLQIIEQGDE